MNPIPSDSVTEAIGSEVLKPHLPEIRALRQRIIRGNFKNDDLFFAQA